MASRPTTTPRPVGAARLPSDSKLTRELRTKSTKTSGSKRIRKILRSSRSNRGRAPGLRRCVAVAGRRLARRERAGEGCRRGVHGDVALVGEDGYAGIGEGGA